MSEGYSDDTPYVHEIKISRGIGRVIDGRLLCLF